MNKHLIVSFIVTNVVLCIVFWLVRWPIMHVDDDEGDDNNRHFVDIANRDLEVRRPSWLRALYASVMTQTTVGASDIVPQSATALGVTSIQAFSAIASIAIVLLLAKQKPFEP